MYRNAICNAGAASTAWRTTWQNITIFDLPRKRRSDEVERVLCWLRARHVVAPCSIIGRGYVP